MDGRQIHHCYHYPSWRRRSRDLSLAVAVVGAVVVVEEVAVVGAVVVVEEVVVVEVVVAVEVDRP